MGADSDVSIKISGNSSKNSRLLWLFADTFIAKYNKTIESRETEGVKFIRNSIGIQNCDMNDNCNYPPTFHWRTKNGSAETFFT